MSGCAHSDIMLGVRLLDTRTTWQLRPACAGTKVLGDLFVGSPLIPQISHCVHLYTDTSLGDKRQSYRGDMTCVVCAQSFICYTLHVFLGPSGAFNRIQDSKLALQGLSALAPGEVYHQMDAHS